MLLESVETINKRLAEIYGIDTESTDPIFRVVWSEDQYEMRRTKYSDAGIELLHEEVRNLPKYRQWVKEKYVLERLVLIPDTSMPELPATRKSYEPLWVFRDEHDNALPPVWQAIEFIIATLYAALGKSNARLVKYVDDEVKNPNAREERVQAIQKELYSDETVVTDHLRFGTGVTVPTTFEPSKDKKDIIQ